MSHGFTPRLRTGQVLLLLTTSMACVAIAPALMPDSYTVLANAVSESAGQGIGNAWVARTGFLALGFAVLLVAQGAGARWGIWGRTLHRAYGVSLIAAAAYSHMPWEDVPFDAFEDFLHSVAASTAGAAFTVGVLIVTFRRGSVSVRTFDWIAIIASPAISMTMFNVPHVAGLVQRVLFLIAYLWYGFEAIGALRGAETATAQTGRVPEHAR